MKKQWFLIGLAGAMLFKARCQKEEEKDKEHSEHKQTVQTAEKEKETAKEPVTALDPEIEEDAPKENEFGNKAKQTVETLIESLKKEDINLYNSLINETYKTASSEQTKLMFDELDLDYKIIGITLDSADEKGAIVTAHYVTSLKTGDKASFSDNESKVQYKLIMENGEYKVSSHEVMDVQFFVE